MYRPARIAAAAAALALISFSAAPAFAGTAENAYLSSIAGSWSGNGTMTGAESGPIACRLSFKPSGARLSYTGRCNVQDMGAQSFAGSIVYNDSKGRYEARSAAGDVIGVKHGNSVAFTTKTSSMNGSAYSVMTVSPSRITIDFTILDQSGNKTRSHVSFNK